MASHSSRIPYQQENRNNNNNNNRNNVVWQQFSCPRCHIRISVYTGHWRFQDLHYSVNLHRPTTLPLPTSWVPCVILHNMVNVNSSSFERRANMHLTEFENPNTVRRLHCTRCTAFLGWKSSFTGRHYLPCANVMLSGSIQMSNPGGRRTLRPNRNVPDSYSSTAHRPS